MTCRITLVLEYPSVADVPRIGLTTKLADIGSPRLCAMQFSDALRELEVLEDAATEATKDKAFAASFDYPGCDFGEFRLSNHVVTPKPEIGPLPGGEGCK